MTEIQARKLGELFTKARAARGISLRQLASESGLATSWLNELEHGHYSDPAQERLTRLAEILDIEPSRIDHITKGSLASGLPGMKTYFRAKYDLTPDQIAEIERYVDGIDGTRSKEGQL